MKKLIINLEENDIENIEHVLSNIADAINSGFKSGIEYPVNWQLKEPDGVEYDFMK